MILRTIIRSPDTYVLRLAREEREKHTKKLWEIKNKDKRKAQMAAWRAKNRDKENERKRRWRQENREHVRAYERRRFSLNPARQEYLVMKKREYRAAGKS